MLARPRHGWSSTGQKFPHSTTWPLENRPGDELYDLKKDPDQMHNVAAAPAYSETLKKLSAQLMDELKRTGDPRVMGDGSTYDKPPFGGK